MREVIEKHIKSLFSVQTDADKDRIVAIVTDLYEYHTVQKGKHPTDLPEIDEQKWCELTGKYTKDQIVDAICVYIIKHKSKFPFKHISRGKMQDCYDNLKAMPHSSIFYVPEFLNGIRVMERFDYKYGFDKCDEKGKLYGLACIKLLKEQNHVSDYFMEGERYRCGSWTRRSGYHLWTTGYGIRAVISPLFRMGKKTKVDFQEYATGVRLGTYLASSFKPTAAKGLYEVFGAKTVLDFSCGWGDRLAGFFASTAKTYYGCDPNDKVYSIYQKQCLVYNALDKMITIPTIQANCELDYQTIDYGKLASNAIMEVSGSHFEFVGDRKRVKIFNQGAETFDVDQIDQPLDLIFTSPPYFDTEKYGANSENTESQSWKKFDTFTAWRDEFLYKVLSRVWTKLRVGGIMAINITDVAKAKKTQKLCDDMVDWCVANLPECKFRGQIGMILALRPNSMGDRVDHDETNKTKFIEPIWVFQKGGEFTMNLHGTEDVEDLFEE
jgi:hypothetical protein